MEEYNENAKRDEITEKYLDPENVSHQILKELFNKTDDYMFSPLRSAILSGKHLYSRII